MQPRTIAKVIGLIVLLYIASGPIGQILIAIGHTMADIGKDLININPKSLRIGRS